MHSAPPPTLPAVPPRPGPGDRRGGQRLGRSRRRPHWTSQLRWTSPGRWRWSFCSRRKRRSVRWPPRWSSPAVPAGVGLRAWTTNRRHDQWQFLRRYSAVRVSRSRVCPYELDAGFRCAARPHRARRGRHPRRGARYRGGARRGRRDGDCTGRSSVSGNALSDYDRPETIEETAQLVSSLGGVGIPIQVDHLGTPDVVDQEVDSAVVVPDVIGERLHLRRLEVVDLDGNTDATE